MKETGQSHAPEQLPPSLADNLHARFSKFWATHNPLNGDTAQVGLQEHERIIRALEDIGVRQTTSDKLRRVASVHAKTAGLSAFATNFFLEGLSVGYFGSFFGPIGYIAGIYGAVTVHRLAPADRLIQLSARVYGSVGEKVVQGVGSIAGTNKA